MKRLKKIFKWIAIVVAVGISFLLLTNAWYVWSTGSQLAAKLADLRAAGEPIQLADLARKSVPAEQNAATYLGRAASDLKLIQKEILSQFPQHKDLERPLSTEEQEKLSQLFAAYPQVVPLLEQASNCSTYDLELDCSVLHSQFMDQQLVRVIDQRDVARVLSARNALLVSSGKQEEAFANALLMLRLAKRFEQESLLVQYLVVIACRATALDAMNRVLQAGPVPEESRKALEEELKLHDTLDAYRHAMKTERAAVLSAMDELPGSRYWLARGFVSSGKLRLIDLFDRELERASRPFAEIVENQATKSASKRPRSSIYWLMVDELLAPAVDAANVAMKSDLGRIRALRIVNAIQRKSPPEGEIPKLEGLGLEGDATLDPFSGNPLLVKRLAEGWQVYSVGRNREDDGGKFENREDDGFGPIVPQAETSPSPMPQSP